MLLFSLGAATAKLAVFELISSNSFVIMLETFFTLGTWSPKLASFTTALLSCLFITTPCPRSLNFFPLDIVAPLEFKPVTRWPTALPGCEVDFWAWPACPFTEKSLQDKRAPGTDLSTLRPPRRVGGANVSIKICGVAFFSYIPSLYSYTNGCLAFTGSFGELGTGDLPKFPFISFIFIS